VRQYFWPDLQLKNSGNLSLISPGPGFKGTNQVISPPLGEGYSALQLKPSFVLHPFGAAIPIGREGVQRRTTDLHLLVERSRISIHRRASPNHRLSETASSFSEIERERERESLRYLHLKSAWASREELFGDTSLIFSGPAFFGTALINITAGFHPRTNICVTACGLPRSAAANPHYVSQPSLPGRDRGLCALPSLWLVLLLCALSMPFSASADPPVGSLASRYRSASWKSLSMLPTLSTTKH
jgi:hypothetical protein